MHLFRFQDNYMSKNSHLKKAYSDSEQSDNDDSSDQSDYDEQYEDNYKQSGNGNSFKK